MFPCDIRRAYPKDAEKIAAFLDEMRHVSLDATFDAPSFAKEHLGCASLALLAWEPPYHEGDEARITGLLVEATGTDPDDEGAAEFAVLLPHEPGSLLTLSHLMEFAQEWSRNNQAITSLSCRVHPSQQDVLETLADLGIQAIDSTPTPAVTESHEVLVCTRRYHRDTARDGKPLFFLGSLLTALEHTDQDSLYFACLETAALESCSFDEHGAITEGFNPYGATGRWIALPTFEEIGDQRCMHAFARAQPDPEDREALLEILEEEGPGVFVFECDERYLLDDYVRYESEHHTRIALSWLEAHNCIWTEGRPFDPEADIDGLFLHLL